MIFRQLFEPETSSYTYLLGCAETRLALLIDPVLATAERDLAELADHGLTLSWTVETHIHADHVTGACRLRTETGCRIAATPGTEGADTIVAEGVAIEAGSVRLQPLPTPGHTDDHHCYFVEAQGTGRVFTGDTLLIDGCGRTDFQGGDAATLYRSVHDKIFSLPEDTLLYPGHDYQQRRVSSVAQERARNPRLGGGKTVEEFVAIMAGLGLPHPKQIDVAVPANRLCGGPV
jgi:glyoxylase-like metal-dependent hydrolase (beta-lactamase superfamily II)